MATTSKAPSQSEAEEHHGPPFRWTALWIGVVLVAILAVAIVVGAAIKNLNQTRMVAIFAIGVVSFLGMLGIGRQGQRPRAFEPGEVRTALTTAFTMVFFAAVGIFLFSTNSVSEFGRTLMDNLTSLSDPASNDPTDIAADASNDVFVAGTGGPSLNEAEVDHFDGSTWTREYPNGTVSGDARGITLVGQDVWIAGDYRLQDGRFQTMVAVRCHVA